MKRVVFYCCFLMILLAFQAFEAKAQIDFADFTYQGSLKDGGVPANGNYELTFEFFNTPTGGASLGSFVFSTVTVTNGIFTVDLTGNTTLFAPGASVWIQISARPAGSSNTPTVLNPRQRVRSAPLAITSLLSSDSNKLGGVDANQYLTTTGGAASFIQNGTTQQTGGFNLSGTGTANVFNAASQFNINGNRILSAGGADNIFAGFQAGQSNTSGGSNSFFGVLAGGANTTGNFNSFFGRSTGNNNSGGNANSFFGSGAGNNNSTGGNNSFFGSDAGSANGTGSNNTIIGGAANVTLNNLTNATALGSRAAVSQSNSLVLGSINGINGASADTNVGIGLTNPTQRLQVVGNAVFSGNLGIGTTTPNFKFELIDSSNTGLRVQTNVTGGTVASFGGFGAFRVDAPGISGGRFSILENGNVGIGNNAPTQKLSVTGNGAFTGNLTASGTGTFGGNGIFSGNVGIGTSNPLVKLHVVGENLRVEGNSTGVLPRFSLNFTGGGADAKKWQNYAAADALRFSALNDAENAESIWLNVTRTGSVVSEVQFLAGNIYFANGLTISPPTTNVQSRLDVNGLASFDFFNPTNGPDFTICAVRVNGSISHATLSKCGTSSIRYKNNVNDLPSALELIRKLRPVSFNWKANNSPDVGFIAEEVADVEPQLVLYNPDKTVEGVRYEKISIYLVKAAQEQQTEIEAQQKRIDEQAELIKQQQEKLDRQQTEIEALKQIVCANNQTAKICGEQKP
ncbi:MAG: tail fiber domain-containing protein [Pyrinomonadaceae bacterium]